MIGHRWLFLAIPMAAALASTASPAAEFDADLQQRLLGRSVPDAVFRAQLRYPSVVAQDRADRLAYQLRGAASITGRPSNAWTLTAGLDTGLLELGPDGVFLDGRRPADQIPKTLLLGQIWSEVQLGADGVVLIKAGKLRAQVGESAVFDAYAFGALADIDLSLIAPDHPWRLRLQALFPSGEITAETFSSPLFGATLSYRFARRTRLTLHGAAYLDRGAVGPVLSDAIVRGLADAIAGAFDDIYARQGRDPPPPPTEEDCAMVEPGQVLPCAQRGLVQAANSGQVRYQSQTRGTLGWTGLSGRVGGSAWSVEGLLLYGFGEVEATLRLDGDGVEATRARFAQARERFPRAAGLAQAEQDFEDNLVEEGTVRMSSWLAQVTAKVSLTDDLSVDGFGLALSGDDGLPARLADTNAYGAFISLAPLLAHTSLFFNGGAATAVSSPTVSALAPDAAGLLAAGASLDWFFLDPLHARGTLAVMAALEPNARGDTFEGLEIDLIVDALITDWLLVYVEGAVFVPGPYFGDVPLGYQGIVSAQVRLP